MYNHADVNSAELFGTVIKEFTYSHEGYGERFYKNQIHIPRRSGNAVDILPVMVSDKILDIQDSYKEREISIRGQVRSKNIWENNKSKLSLFAFVKNMAFQQMAERNHNEIYLGGTVCKKKGHSENTRWENHHRYNTCGKPQIWEGRLYPLHLLVRRSIPSSTMGDRDLYIHQRQIPIQRISKIHRKHL